MLSRFTLRTPVLTVQPNQYVYVPDFPEILFYNESEKPINLYSNTPSQIISWFHKLPDLAYANLLRSFSMSKNDFQTDETINEFMNITRDTYFGLELWLSRKHDNIINYPEELYTKYDDLEPMARASLAGLNLIQKIFDEKYRTELKKIKEAIRSTVPDAILGIEPQIWFSCELIAIEKHFLSSGLFGNLIKPNRDSVDNRIREYGNLPEAKIKPLPDNLRQSDFNEAPRNGYWFVELMGEQLAHLNIDFDRDVYAPYTKVKKQTLRTFRRNPVMKTVYIENGEICVSKPGSGTPKKKNSEKKPRK